MNMVEWESLKDVPSLAEVVIRTAFVEKWHLGYSLRQSNKGLHQKHLKKIK